MSIFHDLGSPLGYHTFLFDLMSSRNIYLYNAYIYTYILLISCPLVPNDRIVQCCHAEGTIHDTVPTPSYYTFTVAAYLISNINAERPSTRYYLFLSIVLHSTDNYLTSMERTYDHCTTSGYIFKEKPQTANFQSAIDRVN